MNITEKDLEDLIFDDLLFGADRLMQRGLYCELFDKDHCNQIFWYRQVSLMSYGIADLIGVTRKQGKVVIDLIELKNVPITTKDFDQVLRYETAIRCIMYNSLRKAKYKINSYLVGPSLESGHFIHNSTKINLYTFQFNIDGFQFKHHENKWVNSNSDDIGLDNVRYAQEVLMLMSKPEPLEANG